jgi:hypothetical protein
MSEGRALSSEDTQPCSVKVVFAFRMLFVVGSRFPIKAPMVDVRLEAENHWLRYGRLAPRSLRQLYCGIRVERRTD